MKNGIFAPLYAFATAMLTPAMAWADSAGEGFRHYGGGYMWGGGHGFYGPVMMILVVAIIVAIVVLVVRWVGGGQSAPTGKSPQDILKERYARGEMTTKEYEERRKVLGD
ncbi:MAG: SHOCT domain-containing protein [Proteobacteria bacterium]|nr:SHOCT domain-containing protein [Pseudomonadota bacterium]